MRTDRHANLRARLRSDTRALHEALDERVSRFDLTTQGGLVRFLSMQSTALRALTPHADAAMTRDAIADLARRADSDLSRLGHAGQTAVTVSGPLDPLAIDYVIAGSRLGTRILHERWRAAEDARVRQAVAYFSGVGYISLWKSFCATANGMEATGPLADRIVHDVDVIFQLYLDCADAPDGVKRTNHG